LVASPDGVTVYETSREGGFTEEDAVRIGNDAGAELKAQAGEAFFNW
jgi:hypothetical protein